MDDGLSQKAIDAALSGNWIEAEKINLTILQDNPKNIDALNRLARSYAERGSFKKAKDTANTVLKYDPFNIIAHKSLLKWKGLKKGDTITSGPSSAQVFLEEPGKTKIISLMHLGDQNTLAKLDSGDTIRLNTNCHRITSSTLTGKYIGKLADDISSRIKSLIRMGYGFDAFIKNIEPKEVKIIIREIKRPKEHSDHPSFPTEKIEYISFTPPELVHKKEDRVISEDEEDLE